MYSDLLLIYGVHIIYKTFLDHISISLYNENIKLCVLQIREKTKLSYSHIIQSSTIWGPDGHH